MPIGLFIVLEGIDGAGTTTQARLLAEWLRSHGREVVLTAEPTTRPVGAFIRRILQGAFPEADETTMAFLFAADRADHLQNIIIPALYAGRVVVSDRHYLSSVAYQSLRADMAWVESINAGFYRPDLTVFLDIDPVVGLERKQRQGSAAERYEKVALLKRIRANYLAAIAHARAAGERVETLDASQPIGAVQADAWRLVEALIKAQPPAGADARG
ncbi:MAG TPA: dTMP kinase [Planctomycetota bacterium]|nr:dTMP kinase [Planctomycetota bacterium]HRR81834.1 dTMP kinase [Planctomycetota bacterium]HRT96669.1 dTMP kinase [Planctomycetota bacterium]